MIVVARRLRHKHYLLFLFWHVVVFVFVMSCDIALIFLLSSTFQRIEYVRQRYSLHSSGMLRRFSGSASSAAARRSVVRQNTNASGKAAEAGAEEVVFSRGPPRQKPSNLPEDGTVVYRKGVPIRGKLSRMTMKDKFIVCLVFSLTGSSAVLVVRPALKYLVDNGFMGLPEDSGFVNGPWLYRALYFAIMWPSYSFLLYSFGALFGMRIWFSHMLVKMWGRVLPKWGKERLRNMMDLQ